MRDMIRLWTAQVGRGSLGICKTTRLSAIFRVFRFLKLPQKHILLRFFMGLLQLK